MAEQMEMMVIQNSEKLRNLEKDAKSIEQRIDTCDEQLRKLYKLYFPDGNYEEYMENVSN